MVYWTFATKPLFQFPSYPFSRQLDSDIPILAPMDPKAKPEVDMEAVGGLSKLPAILVTKRGLKEFKLNIPVKPSTENNIMRTRMNTVLPWMGRVELDRTSFVVVVFGLVGALIMLTLITFSAPLIPTLYFIETSKVEVGGTQGVVFGMWGWCLDNNGPMEIERRFCTDTLKLGYLWNTQIDIPVTRALVFYPVSAISTFFTLLTLVPVHKDRSKKTLKVFSVLTWISFVFSLMAFVFMMGVWGIVKERFEVGGWIVKFGPLPLMSLIATILLLSIAVNSWKGTLSRKYCLPLGSKPGLRPLSLKSNPGSVTSTLTTENRKTTTKLQTIIQRIMPFVLKTKDRKRGVKVGGMDMEKGVFYLQRPERESGVRSSIAQRNSTSDGKADITTDTKLLSRDLPQLPRKVRVTDREVLQGPN